MRHHPAQGGAPAPGPCVSAPSHTCLLPSDVPASVPPAALPSGMPHSAGAEGGRRARRHPCRARAARRAQRPCHSCFLRPPPLGVLLATQRSAPVQASAHPARAEGHSALQHAPTAVRPSPLRPAPPRPAPPPSGPPRPAPPHLQVKAGVKIETYDDHRMAMAFSLVAACGVPVTILDPGCTRKTFPTYFKVRRGPFRGLFSSFCFFTRGGGVGDGGLRSSPSSWKGRLGCHRQPAQRG